MALRAAAVLGLSKFIAPKDELVGCPYRVFEFAGDFLNCWGEGTTDRGPWGEKAARWDCEPEKGVETGGVAATGACFPCVGVAIGMFYCGYCMPDH